MYPTVKGCDTTLAYLDVQETTHGAGGELPHQRESLVASGEQIKMVLIPTGTDADAIGEKHLGARVQ